MKRQFVDALVPVLGLMALLAGSNCSVAGQDQRAPIRVTFEDTEGKLPMGWALASSSQRFGYSVAISPNNPKEGGRCLQMSRDARDDNAMAVGNISQTVDAAPFRGKRVRLSAAIRVDGTSGAGSAYLWLRSDLKNASASGFFDNMADRPVISKDWAYYEIVGDIEDQADKLRFGLMLLGNGSAWLDDLTLEVLGPAPALVRQPARALTPRGLGNVTAFARLTGYVRHFYPGTEAMAADWDVFTIRGMREVESAGGPGELVSKLQGLFQPIAPMVRVYPTAEAGGRSRPAGEIPNGAKRVVFLHQIGFGNGPTGMYHRELVSKMLNEATSDGITPVPSDVFRTDLGGGVSCSVPFALYADERGTLPHVGQPKAPSSSLPQPTKVRYTGDDRATRLADVALAWNIFEHYYPYFDITDVDWRAVLGAKLQQAATDKNERDFLRTLEEMVVALRDGHGGVELQSDGETYTVPLYWGWIDDQLVVAEVKDPSSGIARGDVILRIDGLPAAEALARTESLISAATPQWRRYSALRRLALGLKDQPVTFEIEPFAAPGTRSQVTLKRDTPMLTFQDRRPDKIAEMEPGILYLNINEISDADLDRITPRLEKARGIIYDFRGYPRSLSPGMIFAHLIDKPVTSAQWHFPEVSVPDHVNMTFKRIGEWSIEPAAPTFTAKRVFIIDGRAISYAESCLEIVEYYRLGEIVGEATAGTNGGNQPFMLPGGYMVTWTGTKVLKHDGSRHHGVGIRPTVPVTRTRAAIAVGRDEFLEKALEIVKQKGASAF
jgi:C-terminal processing protease CtpA/Prc